MFRLRTLGQLALTNDAAPVIGAACQRKSLALLAILAARGEHGMSRDKLQALLWPEAGAGKAGHCLAQALYALRRELGEDVLGRASEPRLDSEALPSDVADFNEALERGDLRLATGIYTGPFLDGFHLKEAPAFEQWVEEERARFAREYTAALGELAIRAGRRGDCLEAVDWWRRLAEIDRVSSRVAIGYMEALARTGEKAAALQYARVYQTLLRNEYDASPEAAVTNLVERIKLEVDDEASSTSRAPPGPDAVQVARQKIAGRYLITKEAGSGAIASLYVARDLRHGRVVALKLFAGLEDPDLATRLTSAANLHHPHILPLYDAGVAAEGVFCVSPHIEEGSLRTRYEREGPLPLAEAVAIVTQAAEALDYAHRHGVVHGHLTSENILLEEGQALVADFGMRPGTGTDPKSDVHALACVLFEVLTGEAPQPFPSEVSARSLRPSLSFEVNAALERALAPVVADRFTNAAQFATALRTSPRNGALFISPVQQQHSIAVLPFVNLSGEQESEYFSDGMTEELINALSRVPALRVAARSSSFAMKGKNLEARTIGERLRVKMLLEGSVRRAGERLRVSAQLVNAAEGYQCWSQTYDRPVEDVFAVQEEIAQAIVSTLQLQLAPRNEEGLVKAGSRNIDVYDKYLRGRFYWNQRSPEGLKKSIKFFQAALDIDPMLALAYTGIADAHHMLALYGVARPCEVYPAARAAATSALEIGPHLAEAHVSAAHVAFCYDLDWHFAEAEYRRAIELDAHHAPAHHWYAWLLTAMDRKLEATEEVHSALALEPLSPIIVARGGHILGYTSSLVEGEALARLALELNPQFAVAQEVLGMNLVFQGRYEEGLPLLEELAAKTERKVVYYLAWALLKAGRSKEGSHLLKEVDIDPHAERVPPGYWAFWAASAHAELGNWDRAFLLANRLLEERCFAAGLTRADQALAVLDRDPRHKEYRQKLGLT